MSTLKEYRRKRDFKITKEPRGARAARTRAAAATGIFVVQEHHARRLHWDFRLEAEGVLKSWAVTKEPSPSLGVRRLAIETEDHPLDYAQFEGEIPKNAYGAGRVTIWDHGNYEAIKPVARSMENGLVEVFLKGRKLKGRFVLVRTRGEGAKAQWLFFKAKPKIARLKIPEI
ncbi:MAG TPA: DNA polymerase ligase N-terminal domain-containing protein [Bdellovibrionota bacterium]|nr:DNA polymerase ligase N-terminal domain-containing protein [Bdellovibrionota bacterium]